MLWGKMGFNVHKSQLDTLLDKNDVSLEELLEVDELLTEVKQGKNDKLYKYFTKPSVIAKLIHYTTEWDEDGDEKRKFRYPFVSSELLMSDHQELYNVLSHSNSLMDSLFQFVINDTVPQALSLYFIRVAQNLYSRRQSLVVSYLLTQGKEMALGFVKHMEVFGMNELLLTLLGSMDEDDRSDSGQVTDWWLEQGGLAALLARLSPQEENIDTHINIIRMLCEIVRRAHCPSVAKFAAALMEPDWSAQLIDIMMADLKSNPHSTVFTEGTNVIISIMDTLVRTDEIVKIASEPTTSVGEDAPPRVKTVQYIASKVSDLVEFLISPGKLDPIEFAWGTLSPPLGYSRLKVVELLLVLLKTRIQFIEQSFLDLNAFEVMIDLFFRYDMNNLLHILVDDTVSSILASGSQALIKNLFEHCKLLDRIVSAVNEDMILCEEKGGRYNRKGIFGYLNSMSERIALCDDPMVVEYTYASATWKEFVVGVLKQKLDAARSVLGGLAQPRRAIDVLGAEMCLLPIRASTPMTQINNDPQANPLSPTDVYAPSQGSGFGGGEEDENEDCNDKVDRDIFSDEKQERDPEFDARSFLDLNVNEEVVAEEWKERMIEDNTTNWSVPSKYGMRDEATLETAPEERDPTSEMSDVLGFTGADVAKEPEVKNVVELTELKPVLEVKAIEEESTGSSKGESSPRAAAEIAEYDEKYNSHQYWRIDPYTQIKDA